MQLHAPTIAWVTLAAASGLSALALPVQAQVTIHPQNTTPASWERFAIRVVNGTDTATTGVRVDVPNAVTVLGVQPTAGWTARHEAATDSLPQVVEWSGGKVLRGEFVEFSFLGRVMGDARRTDLVFPVTLTRESGSRVPTRRLRVTVVGRTQLSVRGVTAIAGTALGVSLIALILAIGRGRRDTRDTAG